jgi:hypothetical protein
VEKGMFLRYMEVVNNDSPYGEFVNNIGNGNMFVIGEQSEGMLDEFISCGYRQMSTPALEEFTDVIEFIQRVCYAEIAQRLKLA